jgi:hypothetical protein
MQRGMRKYQASLRSTNILHFTPRLTLSRKSCPTPKTRLGPATRRKTENFLA